MMNPTTHEMAVPIASSVTLLLCLPFVAFAGPPDGYYDGVDATDSTTLRTTLHAVIDDHERFPYTNGEPNTWDILNLADEDPNNSSNILDVYRNASYPKIDGGDRDYNREHTWPKSYGFPASTHVPRNSPNGPGQPLLSHVKRAKARLDTNYSYAGGPIMKRLPSFIAAALLCLCPSWVSASHNECPADLDGDGDVDAADLAQLLGSWGPCFECGDGVVEGPEECDPPDGVTCDDNCQFIEPSDCCFPRHHGEGCEDAICESSVCEVDPFCCDTEWDEQCAAEAAELCPECFGLDCCFGHDEPGCSDPDCESLVCDVDPECCSFEWDYSCVNLAEETCPQCEG